MECSDIPGEKGTLGRCQTDCPYLYPYIVVDVVSGVAGTISIVPICMAIIKTVQRRDKPIAVALTTFLNGFLGFLPAPVVYGKVIDSSCTLWRTLCGDVGACALYDLASLRYRVKSMDVGLQFLSAAAYVAALLMFKYGVVEECTPSDVADVQRREEKDVPFVELTDRKR